MKKPLILLIIAIVMMMANVSVHAQDSRISFIHESGDEIHYDARYLAELISTSDTLLGEDEFLLTEYESVFPPQRGSHEPAILVLLPDDYEFFVIVIQENKKGKILALRILTRDGWIEADEESLLVLKNTFK